MRIRSAGGHLKLPIRKQSLFEELVIISIPHLNHPLYLNPPYTENVSFLRIRLKGVCRVKQIICVLSTMRKSPTSSSYTRSDGPPFVGILFCPECNNMLYPKEDKETKTLYYACRNCPHKQLAQNKCVYVNKIVQDVDELRNIVPDVINDPALPRTDCHPCPQCGRREAVFFQADSRRADSEMRLYYVCRNPKCLLRWTE
ncbi:hypothetical protein Zmor_015205 [Zophobas morio]|uniref:TFIIS-type domain-containing protein n=1 Tax=Zophobas morio TaxID=2755281 RepID=A0AA38MGB6_9CUCU|nr:hypothetical protein Zmor_015205 [Zophobas morio]